MDATESGVLLPRGLPGLAEFRRPLPGGGGGSTDRRRQRRAPTSLTASDNSGAGPGFYITQILSPVTIPTNPLTERRREDTF